MANILSKAVWGLLLVLWQLPSANAGVVYRWVNVTVNPVTGPITGQLVIREDQWFDGLQIQGVGTYGNGPAPAVPALESFSWLASTGFGFLHTAASPDEYFNWRFDIGLSGQVNGRELAVDNQLSTLRLVNTGDALWRIDTMSTDLGGPCFFDGGLACQGATGSWVLDTSTLPVPEPGSLVLTALGLWMLRFKRGLRGTAPQPARPQRLRSW